MTAIEVNDFVLYTPFKGTSEEDGQHRVKVLEVREHTLLATDIFGKEFELGLDRIESVDTDFNTHEREFFDNHVGQWKNT